MYNFPIGVILESFKLGRSDAIKKAAELGVDAVLYKAHIHPAHDSAGILLPSGNAAPIFAGQDHRPEHAVKIQGRHCSFILTGREIETQSEYPNFPSS